jgi:hypothetical protein
MLCAVESSKPTRSVDSEWLFGPKTGGSGALVELIRGWGLTAIPGGRER